MDEQIGRNIQRFRYLRGLTQEDLAEALGLDRTGVSRIEQGKRPLTASELVRVAKTLGTEVTTLLASEDVGSPAPPKNMLLRAERVGEEDRVQLDWFTSAAAVADCSSSVPPADTWVGRWRERARRLPPKQGGEFAARRLRAASGIGDAPLLGLSGFAQRLGIAVFAARLPSRSRISGCLIPGETGGSAALVNANHPPARQRFTLAHEIGHHLMDVEAGGHVCGTTGATRPGRRAWGELRADVFASALLIPRGPLEERTKRAGVTMIELQALEEDFLVSHAALVSRARGLGLMKDAEARAAVRLAAKDERARPWAREYRRVGETLAAAIRRSQPEAEHLWEGCAVVADDEVVR